MFYDIYIFSHITRPKGLYTTLYLVYIMDHKCSKCSYEWKSLMDSPKVCPRCKSYKWKISTSEVDANGNREKVSNNIR